MFLPPVAPLPRRLPPGGAKKLIFFSQLSCLIMGFHIFYFFPLQIFFPLWKKGGELHQYEGLEYHALRHFFYIALQWAGGEWGPK